MRKLFILFAAVALMFAFSMPAVAKVHMGGIIFTDFTIKSWDKEVPAPYGAGSGADGDLLQIQVPNITRLYGKWTNATGDVGMFIEFGIDGNGVNERGVVTRHAYGWWQINPSLKLLVGQTTTGFTPLNPRQMLGLEAGPLNVIGVGYGNIYPGRVPQVRLDIKTGAFGLKIAAVDPNLMTLAAANPAFPGEPGKTANMENSMPRFDISADFKLGPVTIYPGISFAEKSWANVAAGNDDSIETTAYSVGFKAAFGALSISGEYNAGENLGNQEFHSVGLYHYLRGAAGTYTDAAGNLKIADTDTTAYWVDLAYKVGTATIHLIYGSQETECDHGPGTADNVKTETNMMGISIPIAVAKTFLITPEYFIYDMGDYEVGDTSTNMGEYSIAGVQFQIVF